MHRKSRRGAVPALVLLLVAGCGPRIIIKRGGPPPAWVDRQPRHAGRLCAVGYSGPTFYQQDCAKNAAENARSHLAESISVTIRTVTLDISDGTRGSFDRDVFVEGSESASEVVLQGVEVQAQWLDVDGSRGERNGCYAWVCIDPSKPLEQLVDKLEEKKLPPKTVEKVRQDAAAAFEELERQERKRSGQTHQAPPAAPEAPKTPQPAPAVPTEEGSDEPGQPAGADNSRGPQALPAVRTIPLPHPDRATNDRPPGKE